ncbi:MAG TPA: SCO family protein [Candidatus Acidoferrales bacterium]|nr:SCO family protein [Candidatus Acidoferrales bacterium]
MTALVAMLFLAVLPIVAIHGQILHKLPHDRIVVVTDAIPKMLTSRIRAYRAPEASGLRVGTQIDAFLDRRTSTLSEIKPASRFVAGSYNPSVTHVLTIGDSVPDYTFLDQDDRLTKLAAYRGKVVILSFVFTRCPDVTLCPAISGKFSYMQHHLDPAHFHLVEVTLDPLYDSPPILKSYGRQFAADASRWSLFTGQPAEIGDMIDQFGISSLQVSPANFIHDDRLVIVDGAGKIRESVPTADWNPDDVVAMARNIANLSSNPLRRWEFDSIAKVLSLCGGSISAGNVILDSAVFLLGVAILGSLLVWFTHQIWTDR